MFRVCRLGEWGQRAERQSGRQTPGLPALDGATGNPDLVRELLGGHACLVPLAGTVSKETIDFLTCNPALDKEIEQDFMASVEQDFPR